MDERMHITSCPSCLVLLLVPFLLLAEENDPPRKGPGPQVVFQFGIKALHRGNGGNGTEDRTILNARRLAELHAEELVRLLEGPGHLLEVRLDGARSPGSGNSGSIVPLRAEPIGSPGSEDTLKSLEELLVLFHESTGHGQNLLLGISPDDRGQLPGADQKRLLQLGLEIRRRLNTPLASAAGTGTVQLELDRPHWIDQVVLREEAGKGGAAGRYRIDALTENGWKEVVRGRTVGSGRIHLFSPLRSTGVRLEFLEAEGTTTTVELSAFDTGGDQAMEILEDARDRLSRGTSSREVRDKLSRALEKFPAHGPLLLLRGQIYEEEDLLEEALEDFHLALSLYSEESGSISHLRAGVLFKLERFEEALGDYNRSIARGRPHDRNSCWERGLAWYYLGDFKKGQEQFEGYHRVGPLDIENGIWRFLCIAEREGLESARKTILSYPRRVRKPFPALLSVYLGEGSTAEVLTEATEGVDSPKEKNQFLFYAHYYLGKYFELLEDRSTAIRHMEDALDHRIPHFMYSCARIDLKRLRRKT